MAKRRMIFILLAGILLLITVANFSLGPWFARNAMHYVPFEKGRELPVNKSIEAIPRIIHQTFKTTEIPDHWRRAQSVVKQQHDSARGYQYLFWTDDSMRQFLSEKYSWSLSTYDSYAYPIQRVDAFRYFVLYHYGGFYVDLDVGARRCFDILLKYDVVLAETRPFGFTNDFLASRPEHPFFLHLMKGLRENAQPWWQYFAPSLAVLVTAGPLYLTRQYHSVAPEVVEDVVVMNEALYESPDGLLFHEAGGSWHGLDATLFDWILDHPLLSLAIVCVAVVGSWTVRVWWRRMRCCHVSTYPT